MNVLILTPDAVGSTLLQRLITIYMQFHEFDRPVINLHELTNGLEKYWSPDFGCEIVSKKRVEKWGYYQTLQQIVDLLSSVDHYKTSRLAHYHLKNRQDSLSDQIPFYRYLDQNFYIISCRRENVFEHAVSMTLSRIHKQLNVYTHKQKIDTFGNLYQNPINLDLKSLLDQLEAYKNYLAWSTDYFNISSYFSYEKHLPEIERYILDLPMFASRPKQITWQQNFGIDFHDWNRCNHIPSDIGSLALQNKKSELNRLITYDQSDSPDIVAKYQKYAPKEWPAVYNKDDYRALPDEMKRRFAIIIPKADDADLSGESLAYYRYHREQFDNTNDAIKRMQELDILVTPPPIKKQTLAEKKHLVKNWQECMTLYNEWITANPDVGSVISDVDLEQQVAQENNYWHSAVKHKMISLAQPHVEQLQYQNDAHL